MRNAAWAGLFPPYCIAFPRNTESIPRSKRLVWQENPAPMNTFSYSSGQLKNLDEHDLTALEMLVRMDIQEKHPFRSQL